MSNNLVYNVDHGFVEAPNSTGKAFTNLYIFGNYYHDPQNWDDAANNNHHDGVHMWAFGAGNSLTHSYVYDNRFYGDFGVNMNSAIYQEAIGANVPACDAWVFNNLIYPSAGTTGNGYIGLAANGGVGCWSAVNNTIVGYSTTIAGELNFNGSAGTAYNNIISTVQTALGVSAAPAAIDNNDYYNLGSGGMTGGGASLATWVSYCQSNYMSTVGCDAHAISGNPNLTANFVPNLGSPVISAGKNLFSTCSGQANPGIGALCFDYVGVARPNSSWDIGAYQYVSPQTGSIVSGNSTTSGAGRIQ